MIEQQNAKPYLLYCKLDPKVEFQNLRSIENHIRLKDPEIHKANLLEHLDEEQKKDSSN